MGSAALAAVVPYLSKGNRFSSWAQYNEVLRKKKRKKKGGWWVGVGGLCLSYPMQNRQNCEVNIVTDFMMETVGWVLPLQIRISFVIESVNRLL